MLWFNMHIMSAEAQSFLQKEVSLRLCPSYSQEKKKKKVNFRLDIATQRLNNGSFRRG